MHNGSEFWPSTFESRRFWCFGMEASLCEDFVVACLSQYDFKFFRLSSRKVWLVYFGSRLMDVCSFSSLSISLVPSVDLFRIPLRFSAHADPGSPVSILFLFWIVSCCR